ncbi:MAG: outer membrane protein assembly factor BamD [Acidobacteriota bacterium]
MRVPKFCLLVLMTPMILSCGQKSAGLQEGAVAPDVTLFENGMKYMDKNQFIKARLAFQTLINTYPDSEYTPVSFLSIADSYYAEGGTENLLQAEAQYKDFIIFYPTHEMADDAQMKVAAVNVRLMRAPDRDPTYARKAEVELSKLLKDYPDSELSPTAKWILREVEENLATGIEKTANFYFDRHSYLASESRYKEIVEKYENYSKLDETLYRLGQSLERLGRVEEASVYYSRLASEYPFSDSFDKSKEKLILLEKDVPPVNEEAARRNESNRRTDSFSILDPIRSVWRVFSGAPDPYEIAKREAEQRRNGTQVPQQGSNGGNGGH